MFWDGGWTNINRGIMMPLTGPFNVMELYEKEKKAFYENFDKANFQKMFEEWGLEAAQYACLNVYRDPISKKLFTSDGSTNMVPREDFENWKFNMMKRMLIAGART